jgi:hypothetical protein
VRKVVFPPILLTAALVCLLPAAPVWAQAPRTFVSAAGSDSNNCTIVATPCRHFAAAYAATAPNGEIYVLDPANYGALTITGPVSIEGHGWASIAAVSGGAAITINANPGDKINIIGVVLDGTALSGTTGIQFNSGGSLNVKDSVIRNFGGNGILFQPNASSKLSVSDTLLADNGARGIDLAPTGSGLVTAAFNRVKADNNSAQAIIFDGSASSGGSITAAVSECVFSDNGFGVTVSSSSGHTVAKVTLFQSIVANNLLDGIAAVGTNAIVTLAQSSVTGNGDGWNIVSGGVIQTYLDNYFNDNGANSGSLTSVSKQ